MKIKTIARLTNEFKKCYEIYNPVLLQNTIKRVFKITSLILYNRDQTAILAFMELFTAACSIDVSFFSATLRLTAFDEDILVDVKI